MRLGKHSAILGIVAFLLPAATTARATQDVFLDFDTFTGGGDYLYTAADRTFIADRLGDIYAGFDIDFSTSAPMGTHSTIFFNFGAGPYGGTSDHIDFLNVDKSDDAYVLAPDLLTAMSIATTPENIVKASANLAAHELGHILGLKHGDAFGPPFAGISIAPGAYTPAFPGPVAGTTAHHVMGLSSSLSLSEATLLSMDTHLNFREAIKLAAIDKPGTPDSEIMAPHDSPMSAQALSFSSIVVPNTMVGYPGGEAFTTPTYSVLIDSVEATLSPMPGPVPMPPVLTDYYSFTGTAGEIVVIEVFSESLAHRLGDTTDPVVLLLDDMGLVLTTAYFGSPAVNNDEFESTDSILMDVLLPYSGKFFIEVGPKDPLDLMSSGAYQLFVYRYTLNAVPTPSGLTVGLGAMLMLAMRRHRSAR